MDYSISWNKIVAQYNKNLNSKEEIVQNSWETLFSTLFNYDDSDIESQRPVKDGCSYVYPDIIIKNGKDDLFVVELKRHTIHDGREQLFSYLNQLKINIGIVVCDKLYIYDFDYISRDNNYSELEIAFTPNNPDGEKFIELFNKDNYDSQKIKDFIKEKNKSKSNVEAIRNLLDDEENLHFIIKTFFSDKYPEEDVEKVLSDLRIIVESKIRENDIHTEVNNYSPIKKHKNEKFLLNNQLYGKNRFVLAVVREYVKTHPKISYDELKRVFPDSLQGNFGVFQDDKTVKQTALRNHADKEHSYHKCYFVEPDEKIFLQSENKTIVVSTQWGHNFDAFFNRAKEVNLNVERH